MIEVNVTGINGISYPHMATWEWHVALYLFLGGLVAGLMIFSAFFHLRGSKGMERVILVADLLAFPLLAIGLIFLWLDLARRWNAWRFYVTFQPTSAMSWGAWILLFTMVILALRILTHIPHPASPPTTFLGRIGKGLWGLIAAIGELIAKGGKILDVLMILLGVGLGAYTGFLLSTIPARPLWNSILLPALFLVSGLASGCAVLFLFCPAEQLRRYAPLALGIGFLELLTISGYLLSLAMGSDAMQRSLQLLMTDYALGFWGIVIGVGLIIPITIEMLEVRLAHVPAVVVRIAPILILIGGFALRFVVLYAGLESSV